MGPDGFEGGMGGFEFFLSGCFDVVALSVFGFGLLCVAVDVLNALGVISLMVSTGMVFAFVLFGHCTSVCVAVSRVVMGPVAEEAVAAA